MRVYMRDPNTTIGAIGLSYKSYTISLSTIAVQGSLSEVNDTFAEVLVYSKADHNDCLLHTRGDASTILQKAFAKIDEAERLAAGVINDMVTITVSRAVLHECQEALAKAIEGRHSESDCTSDGEILEANQTAINDLKATSDALYEAKKRADRGLGVWGELLGYPVSDWQDEVAVDDTRLGYREWVELQLEADQ
jgi:hypothetical protein